MNREQLSIKQMNERNAQKQKHMTERIALKNRYTNEFANLRRKQKSEADSLRNRQRSERGSISEEFMNDYILSFDAFNDVWDELEESRREALISS